MLTLKVLFYRINKAPVTVESKRVKVSNTIKISELNQMKEDFLNEFLQEYGIKDAFNYNSHYTLQG